MAFEDMVRNFIVLVEEGVRRMLRVTRKGIRMESLAEYALLPREDGSPAWISLNSFDMLSESGFWQAKFIPMFDAKFENGLINNALQSGISLSSSTAGETVATTPGIGGEIGTVPNSWTAEWRRYETLLYLRTDEGRYGDLLGS